jgi:hypothetical protein
MLSRILRVSVTAAVKLLPRMIGGPVAGAAAHSSEEPLPASEKPAVSAASAVRK